MRNNKYVMVGTINIKIQYQNGRKSEPTFLAHNYNYRSIGTNTSIKGGGVKVVLWTHPTTPSW